MRIITVSSETPVENIRKHESFTVQYGGLEKKTYFCANFRKNNNFIRKRV